VKIFRRYGDRYAEGRPGQILAIGAMANAHFARIGIASECYPAAMACTVDPHVPAFRTSLIRLIFLDGDTALSNFQFDACGLRFFPIDINTETYHNDEKGSNDQIKAIAIHYLILCVLELEPFRFSSNHGIALVLCFTQFRTENRFTLFLELL
jgi:hypothetical protein